MDYDISTPSRRNVLKYASGVAASLGLTSTVTASDPRNLIDSAYDGYTDAWSTARCYIYEDAGADRDYTDAAFSHVRDGLRQAHNADKIHGYVVKSYNTRHDPTCPDELLPEFETWRNNHGYTERGVHLLVNSCPQDTVVPGTSDGDPAFTTDSDAHASTYENSRSLDPFRGTSMMEPLHSWVSSDCADYVQPMMAKEQDGDGWNEHTLGTVVEEGYWNIRYNTPMAGGDYSVKNGSCNDDGGTANNETSTISRCSEDALEYSAEHQHGFH
jgi:hypothetical protein